MMLANGALCRVGAPKTCARGLPQLARFLHRTLLSRSVSNQPAIRALSRAYASVLEARRSYATTTSATKPTATVTKAVKAKAASKAPPKTKATAKTAKTTKSPATKKAASKAKPKAKAKKAKAAPKKPAAKKRVTKVLAPEAKEKLLIKELRKTALKEPVSTFPISAYNCFLGDQTKGTGQEGTSATRLVNASRKFKEVTPAELEVSV
jgi:outer membrane biosynthesis protein TonB